MHAGAAHGRSLSAQPRRVLTRAHDAQEGAAGIEPRRRECRINPRKAAGPAAVPGAPGPSPLARLLAGRMKPLGQQPRRPPGGGGLCLLPPLLSLIRPGFGQGLDIVSSRDPWKAAPAGASPAQKPSCTREDPPSPPRPTRGGSAGPPERKEAGTEAEARRGQPGCPATQLVRRSASLPPGETHPRAAGFLPSGLYWATMVTVCPALFRAAAACSCVAFRRLTPFTWQTDPPVSRRAKLGAWQWASLDTPPPKASSLRLGALCRALSCGRERAPDLVKSGPLSLECGGAACLARTGIHPPPAG